mgnify:CR=1 FL=1
MTSYINSLVLGTTVLPAPTLSDPTAATLPAYASAINQLLPQGLAWNRPAGSTQEALVQAIAKEFALVGAQVDVLLTEMDPHQANQLLSEWEANAGLPDPVSSPPADIPGRQAVLVARLNGNRTPSITNIVAAALTAGYAITTYTNNAPVLPAFARPYEFRVARAGSAVAGDPCMGVAWAFAFGVVYTGALQTDTLEALIERISQAHTAAIYDYGIFLPSVVVSDYTVSTPSSL